jgi:hypothetical protein
MSELEAHFEDCRLAKVRNVVLDVAATYHMIQAKNLGEEWNCSCPACEYVRAEPRLVAAIQKALNKGIIAA